MAGFGIGTLYLITEHTSFLKNTAGVFCMVQEEGTRKPIRMYGHSASADRLRKRSFAAACRTGVFAEGATFCLRRQARLARRRTKERYDELLYLFFDKTGKRSLRLPRTRKIQQQRHRRQQENRQQHRAERAACDDGSRSR